MLWKKLIAPYLFSFLLIESSFFSEWQCTQLKVCISHSSLPLRKQVEIMYKNITYGMPGRLTQLEDIPPFSPLSFCCLKYFSSLLSPGGILQYTNHVLRTMYKNIESPQHLWLAYLLTSFIVRVSPWDLAFIIWRFPLYATE